MSTKVTTQDIDSYVGLLHYSPNNYQKWRENFSIHMKEKYGPFAKAIKTQKDLTFDLVKDFNVTATEGPEYSEFLKESIKKKIAYEDAKPKIFGDIMKHLSEDSTIRVRAHQGYADAMIEDNFIALWKLVETTHMTNPATLSAQIATERNIYKDMKQGNMGIDKYNEKFKFQVEKLTQLGKPPDADEAVSTYLYSLNQDFVEIAKAMLKNSKDHPLPSNLSDATAHISEWYSSETAINKQFGLGKPSANTEAAHSATSGNNKSNQDAAKNGGKKGKGKRQQKGKPTSDKDTSQSDKSQDKTKTSTSTSTSTSTKECEWCKFKGFKFGNHTTPECGRLKKIVVDDRPKVEKKKKKYNQV